MKWDHRQNRAQMSFNQELLEQIEQKINDKVESTLREDEELCIEIDVSGASLLHYAAESGNDSITRYLINSGSKINLQNKNGNTPLLLATKKQQIATIKVLLESDADIYICDIEGITALQIALHANPVNVQIAKLFLQKVNNECTSDSVEIARRLMEIKCPIYVAVLLKNVDVTMCMLSQGCLIDAKDSMSGKTVLHFAVENLDSLHVEKLTSLGVDVNVKDASGKLPLAMLYDFSNSDEALRILKTLIKAETMFNSDYNYVFKQLRSILHNGTEDAVEIVLEFYLPDFGVTDQYNRNAIHYLAKNCNPGIVDIVKDLLDEKTIDVDERDDDGLTALHYAMSVGNVNFVKLLIKEGANINMMSNNGVTPFLQAISSSSESTLEKRVECVKILMMNRAYADIYMGHYFNRYTTESSINRNYPLLEPVIAMLALWEKIEKPFDPDVMRKINEYPRLQKYFDVCMSELEIMKNEKFYKGVTLFGILVEDDNFKSAKNSTFFRSKNTKDQIEQLADKYTSISFYKDVLKYNVCRNSYGCMSYFEAIIFKTIFRLLFTLLYLMLVILALVIVLEISAYSIFSAITVGIIAIVLLIIAAFYFTKIFNLVN